MTNDLISREALKEVIKANHYLLSAKNNSTDYGMFTTGIMQAIDNAPTVEHSLLPLASDIDSAYMRGYEVGKAEGILKANTRPQGEWRITRLKNSFDDVYCPFCKARPTRSAYGYYVLDKFCNGCGARLEGYERR